MYVRLCCLYRCVCVCVRAWVFAWQSVEQPCRTPLLNLFSIENIDKGRGIGSAGLNFFASFGKRRNRESVYNLKGMAKYIRTII